MNDRLIAGTLILALVLWIGLLALAARWALLTCCAS